MSKLRVAILAPIDSSFYPLTITQLCVREQGVEVVGILVLKIFTLARLKREWGRIGVFLLRKVWNKYIFNDVNSAYGEGRHIIDAFIKSVKLECMSLSALADKHVIPFMAVDDINSEQGVKFLRDKKPDIVLFTGSSIIRKQLFEVSGRGILNVHMGMLPRYRGIGVTEWPIIEEMYEKIGIGITLHFMDHGVDTGPIITTRKISIEKGDTFEHIEARYFPEMVNLMMEGVRMACNNTLRVVSQRESDGRQYFALHPRLKEIARRNLAKISAQLN